MLTRHITAAPSRLRWLAVALVGLATLAGAGGAIFVKIPGVPGDVSVEGYEKGEWFAMESGWYGTERDLYEDGKAGTADINIGIGEVQPLGLGGHLGRATIPLLQASINGNSIGDVEVHLVDLTEEGEGGKGGTSTFSIIKLGRAFVKSFSMGGGEDGRPWYEFELFFNTIEVTNRIPIPIGEGGGFSSFTSFWNVVDNTGKYTDGSLPNEPPTISDLANASIPEDGRLEVSLSVTDPDGLAADLSVTAISSDPSLVPGSNISVTGVGSSRMLTLTPAANRHGSAKITVIASDLNASSSTSFDLTVQPAPDPPSIAEIGYQVGEAGVEMAILIDASDPDGTAESLSLSARAGDTSLVAGFDFIYGEMGWKMSLLPFANRSGSTNVTVSAVDETGLQATTTFLLAINDQTNSAPTDITLAPGAVAENAPPGSPVGILSATDPDGETDVRFELLADAGGRFVLVGDELLTSAAAKLDHESRPVETIVVRASDAFGAAINKELDIVIENVNEPPTISVELPGAILPATPPGVPIPYPNVSLSDPDAGANEVTITLDVLHGALTLDDSGPLADRVEGNGSSKVTATAVIDDIDRVLAAGGLRYSADPGYEGLDSLNASINDNGHTGAGDPITASASDSFAVPPEQIRGWLEEMFTETQLADPDVSGILSDGEGDGLSTLLEYKLAKSPTDPTDAGKDIVLEEVVEEGTAFAQVSFVQRTDASDPYTTLTVEIANATSGWRSGPAVTRIISRVPLGGGLERVTVRAIPPRTAEARQFFRFRVDYLGFAEAFEDPIR